MGFNVKLERPIYHVGGCRRHKARVGIQRRVTKDNAMKWFRVKIRGFDSQQVSTNGNLKRSEWELYQLFCVGIQIMYFVDFRALTLLYMRYCVLIWACIWYARHCLNWGDSPLFSVLSPRNLEIETFCSGDFQVHLPYYCNAPWRIITRWHCNNNNIHCKCDPLALSAWRQCLMQVFHHNSWSQHLSSRFCSKDASNSLAYIYNSQVFLHR